MDFLNGKRAQQGSKQFIVNVFCHILRPIIRLALSNGLMCQEFMQICKTIYVDVASKHYGVAGRKTSISRVAILTGIDRKEIKRIRDCLNVAANCPKNSPTKQLRADRISRVLSGWYQDPMFLDESGHPMELSLHSGIQDSHEASLTSLIKRYGGDVPVTAILKELRRTNTVIELGHGLFKPVKRYFIPSRDEQQAIARAGTVISDIADTLHFNLYSAKPGNITRYEMRATNVQIDPRYLSDFNDFTKAVGGKFLQEIDDWLSLREVIDDNDTQSTKVRLGLGIYWVQGNEFDEG